MVSRGCLFSPWGLGCDLRSLSWSSVQVRGLLFISSWPSELPLSSGASSCSWFGRPGWRGSCLQWPGLFVLQVQFGLVSQSYPTLQPHGLQHTRLPCPWPTPGACSNSCPLNRWCHPTISSSVIPFSSCPQSLPASGSFPVSQLFPWVGQRIGASASASVLPMNIQDWFPLGLTGLISL